VSFFTKKTFYPIRIIFLIKNIKNMRILLFTFAILLMTNCDKTEYVTMIYDETFCANEWSTTYDEQNEAAVLEDIEDYFKTTYDLEFKDISLTYQDPGIVCYACSCTSGTKIFVEVDELFVSILQDENFYLE
jgi:hypothetical protein